MLSLLTSIARFLQHKVGKHVIHREIMFYSTTKKTLDLGCGQSPLSQMFPNRVGVDVVCAPNTDVIADAHALPFVPESFEKIICSEVLEHLTNPKQAVREMARVAENDAELVLTMPFVYPIHEAPYDYQRFTSYGLERLFRPFFRIKTIKALFSEEQTLAILLQRIAFQRSDPLVVRYFYLLVAHLVFRFSPTITSVRYQGLARGLTGEFLTAGYLLVARKRSGTDKASTNA